MRIAVFAKAPEPGAVKTRLAGVLGADAAARLHATLVRRALSTALASRAGAVELWCAPDARHAFFLQCASEYGVALNVQQGGDLGARMALAFETAHAAGEGMVLIGSDCPALAPRQLHAAAMALASNDAVFAPAEDGGYVLVGMSRPVARLFDGIEWGGAGVMAATRERLRDAGARWHELPMLWDVDRPADYLRLQSEGLLQEALS